MQEKSILLYPFHWQSYPSKAGSMSCNTAMYFLNQVDSSNFNEGEFLPYNLRRTQDFIKQDFYVLLNIENIKALFDEVLIEEDLGAIAYSDEYQFSMNTWREWAVDYHGFTWPIPLNETLLTELTTDAELKAAYEKVVAENQTLREQIAEQQKSIDDLRRIIDGNATIQQYPIELGYAVQAWKAVSINTNASKGSTIKAKLTKWIEENNKDNLAKAAIERIATVANWNKDGGAPTS